MSLTIIEKPSHCSGRDIGLCFRVLTISSMISKEIMHIGHPENVIFHVLTIKISPFSHFSPHFYPFIPSDWPKHTRIAHLTPPTEVRQCGMHLKGLGTAIYSMKALFPAIFHVSKNLTLGLWGHLHTSTPHTSRLFSKSDNVGHIYDASEPQNTT